MQTKQTSSHEAVRHSEKKLKNLTFYRNHDLFISWVKTLKEMKANFTIRHSKYTTSITLQDGSKITFILNRYDNRVFIANKMVINDLKDNPKYYQIIKNQHSTKNFGMMNGISPCKYNEVINIDISSAYATTMYATGLIKEKTFKMLQSLGKHERLPAMGMLAKRSLLFNYKDGKIDDTDLEVGDNRQVFFYLIQQVEEAMNECMSIAGEHYLFHWVDGIFINNDISAKKVHQIEKILEAKGYKYKYEKVVNFELKREKDLIIITMNKNGEHKEYKFNDSNKEENFKKLVGCLQDLELHEGANTIRQNVSSPSMLERTRSNGRIDYSTFLDVT
jgi:hypothetical protein